MTFRLIVGFLFLSFAAFAQQKNFVEKRFGAQEVTSQVREILDISSDEIIEITEKANEMIENRQYAKALNYLVEKSAKNFIDFDSPVQMTFSKKHEPTFEDKYNTYTQNLSLKITKDQKTHDYFCKAVDHLDTAILTIQCSNEANSFIFSCDQKLSGLIKTFVLNDSKHSQRNWVGLDTYLYNVEKLIEKKKTNNMDENFKTVYEAVLNHKILPFYQNLSKYSNYLKTFQVKRTQ